MKYFLENSSKSAILILVYKMHPECRTLILLRSFTLMLLTRSDQHLRPPLNIKAL